uniref:Peptidase M12B domain-containing protein n=1 Tax=Strigamia maritima TaxID=126957 RepID=T1IS51_STRMM
MLYFLFTVGLLLQQLVCCHRVSGEDKVLNEFINYYEPVAYSTTADEQEDNVGFSIPWLSIKKEDRSGGYTEHVEIRAFGRVFRLELKRSAKVLNSDADVTILRGTDECVREKMSAKSIMGNLVEGRVENEPNSYVHGALKKGIFTGVIYLENQTLFVERASKYFREKMPFDCVIFRQEDLNMTAFDCGMGPDGYKCDPIRLLQRTGPAAQRVMPLTGDVDAVPERSWFKRTPPKTTCTLKVVADHLFFQHAGDGSADNAIYEMIFHIHEADRIFRATDFNEDGQADNVGFKIDAVEVHMNTACLENPALAKPGVTSDQYLEMFSERDFHNFCVGVAFSGFTFPGRVLGIAWMADADNSGYVGGICEPRLYSTQDQKALSFNSAVITMMLEGRRMPRGITAIAVAHELGHSFGSDHDPYQDPICSPNRDSGGKFIMAAFAVKGDQPNNRFFSPCSKHNMRTVLKKKGTCFTAMATAYCEEMKKTTARDIQQSLANDVSCSTEISKKLSADKLPDDDKSCPVDKLPDGDNSCPGNKLPEDDKSCPGDKPPDDDKSCPVDKTLDADNSCPDDKSPIGNNSCPADKSPDDNKTSPNPPQASTAAEEYTPNIQMCEISDSDCLAPESLCETAGWCPSPHMPDGSLCSDELGECWQGICIINQCLLLKKVSCECSTLENACIVCCKEDSEDDNECKPVQRVDMPWWLLRRPGEPCQGSGECDQYGRCGFKPQDLVRINKSNSEDEQVIPPAASSELDFDDWMSYENEENDCLQFEQEANTKLSWWKKIVIQIMWICLGTVMFFTLVLCICFVCPAVAVGIWCLRQCACMSERTGENGYMVARERDNILPTDIFYQSTENGHPNDLPSVTQCPIPDIQTRISIPITRLSGRIGCLSVQAATITILFVHSIK